MDECKPLVVGHSGAKTSIQAIVNALEVNKRRVDAGRGLHSSTFRLNVSGFCGIGGAFRGSFGDVWEV